MAILAGVGHMRAHSYSRLRVEPFGLSELCSPIVG